MLPVRLAIKYKLQPLKLIAKKESDLDVTVFIKNISQEPALVSYSLVIPQHYQLGFDNRLFKKKIEERATWIQPGEEISKTYRIYSGKQTKEGNYKIRLKIYVHYKKEDQIIHEEEKTIEIKVV